MDLNERLNGIKSEFLRELKMDKTPKTLENFEILSLDEFVKLTKTQEFSINFNAKKAEILNLKSKIEQISNEIDEAVFKIYELNDDEIGLILSELNNSNS